MCSLAYAADEQCAYLLVLSESVVVQASGLRARVSSACFLQAISYFNLALARLFSLLLYRKRCARAQFLDARYRQNANQARLPNDAPATLLQRLQTSE